MINLIEIFEEGGYLSIMHEVHFDNNLRYYRHRFVFIHNDFVKFVSLPFTFQGGKIEYTCGMVLSKDESKLLITFGKNDNTAHIAEMEVCDIYDLFNFDPDFLSK